MIPSATSSAFLAALRERRSRILDPRFAPDTGLDADFDDALGPYRQGREVKQLALRRRYPDRRQASLGALAHRSFQRVVFADDGVLEIGVDVSPGVLGHYHFFLAGVFFGVGFFAATFFSGAFFFAGFFAFSAAALVAIWNERLARAEASSPSSAVIIPTTGSHG